MPASGIHLYCMLAGLENKQHGFCMYVACARMDYKIWKILALNKPSEPNFMLNDISDTIWSPTYWLWQPWFVSGIEPILQSCWLCVQRAAQQTQSRGLKKPDGSEHVQVHNAEKSTRRSIGEKVKKKTQ